MDKSVSNDAILELIREHRESMESEFIQLTGKVTYEQAAKPYVCGYDFFMTGSMTVIMMECNEPVGIQEALEHLKSMAAGSVSKVKRVTVEMAE